MNAPVFAMDCHEAELALHGELSFATVTEALAKASAALAAQPVSRLNLSGVRRGDSAGLALVLALKAQSTKLGRPLTIVRLPESLRVLAQVCEVDALL